MKKETVQHSFTHMVNMLEEVVYNDVISSKIRDCFDWDTLEALEDLHVLLKKEGRGVSEDLLEEVGKLYSVMHDEAEEAGTEEQRLIAFGAMLAIKRIQTLME